MSAIIASGHVVVLVKKKWAVVAPDKSVLCGFMDHKTKDEAISFFRGRGVNAVGKPYETPHFGSPWEDYEKCGYTCVEISYIDSK
jgi:hypothetical protein